YAAQGVAQIGLAAAAPIELGGGSLGHPAVLVYTERFAGTAGGDFIRALALQQAGRSDEARALYQSSALARAAQNLRALEDETVALAMPTRADWTEAWRSAAARSDTNLRNPLTSVLSLTRMTDALATTDAPPRYASGAVGWLALALILM